MDAEAGLGRPSLPGAGSSSRRGKQASIKRGGGWSSAAKRCPLMMCTCAWTSHRSSELRSKSTIKWAVRVPVSDTVVAGWERRL